jgi:hypothetical protein
MLSLSHRPIGQIMVSFAAGALLMALVGSTHETEKSTR